MSTATTAPTAPTLADLLPQTLVRRVALVIGFAFLTALFAQWTIPLPWTPVPITGQTFAVLLAGAALGARDGAASQGLYVLLGMIGLPFYAGTGSQDSGWDVATGATGGYLFGFIVAAALIGALAERRQDRNILTSFAAMAAGTVIIYVFGATWLAHVANMSAASAVEAGVAPFLIGDAFKMTAAAALVPATWWGVERWRRGSN